ncbi:MAG TPA: FtsX-like permease family protein [Anaerolineae bacterium]|nr:FtsX-like permease family protein [Anaerolineae bacterium]
MNVGESVRIAVRSLTVNKMRAALTMLGIIIGVGAVIALLSVGEGVQALVTERLQGVGSNLLFIIPGNGEDSQLDGGRPSLTYEDALAIADPFNVPDVVAVAPKLSSRLQVLYGNKDIRTSITGVTPEYVSVRNAGVALGSFITAEHLETNARVAVLGLDIYEELFPNGEYPLGQTIKINRLPFRVVGVMEEKGGTGFGNEDDQVFIPLTTAQTRLFPHWRSLSGDHLVSVIYAQVVSEERMDAAMQEITELLRQRHKIAFRDDDDFTVISQVDIISIFEEITGVLTIFLGSIAAISLLVGGIGIMNIMLVSVTERTREIGIRKAVGAKRRDILLQFLVEAVALSLVGGFVGIGLGEMGAYVISRLAESLETVVSLKAILLATGFSVAVGLFFGIYPATRAARLHPIDALRYE